MKTAKRRFEQFLFYDYAGIARHLEKMAAKGWQLKRITRLYWEYQKAQPQKRTYAVAYFSEASEFNPHPTPNQQTFHAYCEDAGWTLAAEWAQMQIFCTERENPVAIETDEGVRLEAIHRAMKKNFLPGSVVLLLLSVLQVYLQLRMIASDPVGQLSSGLSVFLAAIWSVLVIQMLLNLIAYALWYGKSQKSVRLGGACAQSGGGYRKLSWLFTGLVVVFSVLALSTFTASSRSSYLWGAILGLINVTVLIALIHAVKHRLKRAEASRRVNLTVTIASCVVLSIVLTGVTTRLILRGVNAGNRPDAVYTTAMPDGTTHTWTLYRDDLPLRVEDLQAVDYAHYSYEWTARESLFLAQYTARQDAFPGQRLAPELSYSIVDVKAPALFGLCLDDYLNRYQDDRNMPEKDRRYFRQTDDPAWQADAVYQRFRGDEAQREYILCWGSRIVRIDFDEIPTQGQIDTAAEKLRK